MHGFARAGRTSEQHELVSTWLGTEKALSLLCDRVHQRLTRLDLSSIPTTHQAGDAALKACR